MTDLLMGKLAWHTLSVDWIVGRTQALPPDQVRALLVQCSRLEHQVDAALMDETVAEEAFKALCREWMGAWKQALSG